MPSVRIDAAAAPVRGASVKILQHAGLLAWRASQRAAGRTVVHCHGCFDIVHPGHIAHLQQARALGDVLVVTVSSDAHVNKGPARPLIPDDLRAASLAALECVDAVYVNPTPTAAKLLGELAPDVFVKGREYERSTDPRFLDEREAVTSRGGRVVFTSGEIVYSSTAIISSLTQTDPFEREKLARLMNRHGLTCGSLANTIRAFEGKRIAVVGDTIIDAYHFCDATGVASEGPMMTLRLLARRDFDGGAAVIARHVAAMGAEATLITHLAEDAPSAGLRSRLAAEGITVAGLRDRRGGVVTKHRYLCDTTKVMKLDEGAPAAVDSAGIEDFEFQLVSLADEGLDAVIFADFGYGTISPTLLDRVLPGLRRKVPVLTGDISGRTAGNSLLRLRETDLLTPTERELREALGDFSSSLPALAWNALDVTGARSLIVTLGRQGALCFDRQKGASAADRLRSEHVPAFCRQPLDPLGCGDALLAAATLTLTTGGAGQAPQVQAATLIGALAAGVQASRLGNDPVTAEDLLTQLGDLLPISQSYPSPAAVPPIRLAS